MKYEEIRNQMTVYTLVDDNRLRFLHEAVKQTSHLKGYMAEIGVYKGGSSFIIAASDPNRSLYSCDSFEGLPEPTEKDLNNGKYKHHKGEFADTSLEEVQKFLSPLKNIVLIKGFFPNIQHNCMTHHLYSFVHIDVDLYQPSMDCLNFFWPRMETGGILVTDDMNWPNTIGGTRSIQEFFKDDKNIEMKDSGFNSYYVIKE